MSTPEEEIPEPEDDESTEAAPYIEPDEGDGQDG